MGGHNTGDPRHQGAEHKGEQLGVGGVDALAGGGQFVVADGGHGPARPGLFEPVA